MCYNTCYTFLVSHYISACDDSWSFSWWSKFTWTSWSCSGNGLDPSSTVRAEDILLVSYGRGLKATPISLLMRSDGRICQSSSRKALHSDFDNWLFPQRKLQVMGGSPSTVLARGPQPSESHKSNGDVRKLVPLFCAVFALLCFHRQHS